MAVPMRKVVNGKTTKFEYGLKGATRTAKTDPMGRTTRYEYNQDGYRTAIIHPDGSSERFSYDS